MGFLSFVKRFFFAGMSKDEQLKSGVTRLPRFCRKCGFPTKYNSIETRFNAQTGTEVLSKIWVRCSNRNCEYWDYTYGVSGPDDTVQILFGGVPANEGRIKSLVRRYINEGKTGYFGETGGDANNDEEGSPNHGPINAYVCLDCNYAFRYEESCPNCGSYAFSYHI